MEKWLYNTQGKPIAFVKGVEVFTCDGWFIGKLEGKQVTNEGYVGEIVRDFYFVRNIQELIRSKPITASRREDCIRAIPGCKPPVVLSWGWGDLKLNRGS